MTASAWPQQPGADQGQGERLRLPASLAWVAAGWKIGEFSVAQASGFDLRRTTSSLRSVSPTPCKQRLKTPFPAAPTTGLAASCSSHECSTRFACTVLAFYAPTF